MSLARRPLYRPGTAAAVAMAVGLGALVSCSADSGTGPELAAISPTSGRAETGASSKPVPIDEGGPLVALPECDAPPPAVPADVSGLLLPDDAVVTAVEDVGELISVRAYVEQTPIQVKQFYAKEPGLELFEIEDEIYEAEVLFGGGQYRSYVKAQAQCQQGSLLLVYVGPGNSGDLPSIGGG